ncbi:PepSY domain-containing protein [Ostreiculturibacter nitratireducens]|uniref:PepSY domain-containing protein n=1 Tax=Ostreiculturibacter nitratireducens TaxID=3075226 RepID=UPI0031B5F356
MKRLLIATAFAAVAVPALAEPSCEATDAPAPVWEAIKSFEEQGGQVVAFKINDGGCYEIYGKVDGAKYEVFFEPKTGEEIERIED